MATDPVRSIQHEDAEHPFVADLRGVLSRLAALPPSIEAPYLTLYLDWRPEGGSPGRRPAHLFFEQERDRLLAEHKPHSPAHDSVSADLERIGAYLDSDVDPATQGLAIIACSARDVFSPLPLPLPVADALITSATPALLTLTKLADDDPPYAALVLDQREANLLIVDQATRRQSLHVRGTDYPRKQQAGGWSQRRYQNRADERIKAFVDTVATEVQRELATAGVPSLIVAGTDEITALFTESVHQSVREEIIGSIPLDIRASEADIIEATLPVAQQAEREREAELIGRIENGAGPGGGAVHGPVETLAALQAGQVMTLAMNDDFTAPGWADYTLPLYGDGAPPAAYPGAGDPTQLVPVALEQELVRLALQSSAEIEIVDSDVSTTDLDDAERIPDASDPAPRTEAARRLDDLGSVGALLRYTLGDDRSTADLESGLTSAPLSRETSCWSGGFGPTDDCSGASACPNRPRRGGVCTNGRGPRVDRPTP